jgi:hypothetical protein
MTNSTLTSLRETAAAQLYASYNFGDYLVVGQDGWQFVVPGNEWSRRVYLEGHEVGPSIPVTFVIRFANDSDGIVESYAIDSKGNLLGDDGKCPTSPAGGGCCGKCQAGRDKQLADLRVKLEAFVDDQMDKDAEAGLACELAESLLTELREKGGFVGTLPPLKLALLNYIKEEFNPDAATDDLLKGLSLRIARGEYVISRVLSEKYFTFSYEGEDGIVFGDALRESLERIAGAKLEEFTDPRYPMEFGLKFSTEDEAAVLQRLAD